MNHQESCHWELGCEGATCGSVWIIGDTVRKCVTSSGNGSGLSQEAICGTVTNSVHGTINHHHQVGSIQV